MAVSSYPLGGRLQLRLIVGMDDQGNHLFKTRSFANVKPTSSDEDVYNIGSALASLQEHDLQEVRRADEAVLIDEP